MTTDKQPAKRLLGSLSAAEGKGVVRMEDRVDTDIEDLWSALTDPGRLARWYGEIEGDLRLGGEFRARLFASEWKGSCRIEACDRPKHLLLSTLGPGRSGEGTTEVTLVADGDATLLVWEERGMPLDLIDAYGAGIQVHVEDLEEHIAGRGRVDHEARWKELSSPYRDLAVKKGLRAPGDR